MKNEKDAAVHAQEFENAANLRDKQTKLENNTKKQTIIGKIAKTVRTHPYLKRISVKLSLVGLAFH